MAASRGGARACVGASWRTGWTRWRATLAIGLVAGCAGTAEVPGRPAWVDGRFSAAESAADLLGVGSAPGRGPEAAETARQRALAAVLQQLSADVTAETRSRDTEVFEQSRRDGSDEESATARTDRQRTITVSSAAQLHGAHFEIASGRQGGAEVTWALARISRDELVREWAGELRAGLLDARQQLETAASWQMPRAAVATFAADALLQDAAERLPLIAAAAGRPSPVHRELTSELTVLSAQTREHLAALTERLDLELAGPPPRLRLSGQLDALLLRALWDDAPLSGLPVAARLGDAGVALAVTGESGLATLHLPQVSGRPGTLRAGIAVDGRLGPLVTTLPVAAPAAASSRVAVLTQHARDDGPGAPRQPRRGPSALQASLEAALGALHFLVLPGLQQPLADGVGSAEGLAPEILSNEARARLAGRADYVLVVTSATSFRSREGRQQQGVLWYGTTLQARFVDVATGEAFSISIPDTDSRDAGINAEQAESRSLARALARLLDEQRPDTLPNLLRARFR